MAAMVPVPSPASVKLRCGSGVNLGRRAAERARQAAGSGVPPSGRTAGSSPAWAVPAGISTVTTNPSPGVEAAETDPPWAATMAATMESPRPLPPPVRARAGSAR